MDDKRKPRASFNVVPRKDKPSGPSALQRFKDLAQATAKDTPTEIRAALARLFDDWTDLNVIEARLAELEAAGAMNEYNGVLEDNQEFLIRLGEFGECR